MNRRIIPYNPNLKSLAKKLRNAMTYSEVRLWQNLNNFQMMGYDFDRQKPVLNYIADFYCKDCLLVIEVDGITHDDDKVFLKDEIRDSELNKYGITVLRFNALDVVNNTKYVLKMIENWILDFEDRNGVEKRVRRRRF